MLSLLSKVLTVGMSLVYKRTILILTLLLCLAVGTALWNMSRLSSTLIEWQARQNGALLMRSLNEARSLYSDEAADRAKEVQGITVSEHYREIEGGIPNPATYTIELGNRIGMDGSGTSVRFYSNYPFPNRRETGGAKDSFEREALQALEKNPTEPFFRQELVKDRLSFRYAEAVIMQPSCVNCHNTHPNSPRKDWKIGDVRGAIGLIQPLDSIVDRTHAGLRETFYRVGRIVCAWYFWNSYIYGSVASRCSTIRTSSHRTNGRITNG